MRNLFLVTLIFVIGFTASAQQIWHSPGNFPESEPEITLNNSNINGFSIDLTINGFYTVSENTDVGKFDRIKLYREFEPSSMDIGSPQMPQIVKLIDIPSGATAKIKIANGDYVELEGFLPYPFQKPLKDGEKAEKFYYNETAYTLGGYYPEDIVTISESGIWRDLQVASLRISPIQYNPETQKLRVYKNITIEVEFEHGKEADFQKPATGISTAFDRIYSQNVINYDPALHIQDLTDEEVGYKYLVICPEEAVDVIEPLINLRHSQGYKIQIMTISPSFRTPQDFKTLITSLYLSDGLEYVLMVGDANLSNPVVPMYYWDAISGEESYSDSWYTCVVPGNDNDYLPELAIGRYVYSNLSELEHQIEKTMDYLLYYDDSRDWFENSLLVAHGENYPQKYTQCKEEIRTYNYSIQNPEFSTIYGGAGGGNLDIVDYINGSSCGLFNYRGHGSETNWPQWSGWSSFTATQVNAMTNQHRLFVIFDICCSNGNIITYYSDCLSETFMKANYAASAIYAAINPSYTDPNHVLDKELYKAVYDDGVNNIGYVTNVASVDMMSGWGDIGKANFQMYFWQGDPAIDIWTHLPEVAEVTAPEIIHPGEDMVEITVEVDGSPLEGAMVCLQNNEVYSVAYTDVNGIVEVVFDPIPMNLGEMVLTVSGHNLAFYQDTLDVIGGFGTIEGTVTSNQTSEPLPGANVSLPYLSMDTETDSVGHYEFADIPAMEYEVTAVCDGYIDSTMTAAVDSSEITQLDFALMHPECLPNVESIEMSVQSGSPGESSFDIANDGDYPLIFNVEISADDAGPTLDEKMSFDGSSAPSDQDIRAAVCTGDAIWAAGSGDGNTHMLHKYTLTGDYIESIYQPSATVDQGFYDLCWDGNYLYGFDSGCIVKFDTFGNLVDTISTNFETMTALTCDTDGEYFYIGNGPGNMYKMDTDGNVMRIYGNSLNVRGLSWWEDDPDGYNIYILSNEPELTITRMDPSSNGSQMQVGEIQLGADESGGGCSITNAIDPQYVMMLAAVQTPGNDMVKGWQVEKLINWLSIEPDSGSIDPGESAPFTAFFDPINLFNGEYTAKFVINHNALNGFSEIPVTMNVSGASAGEYTNDPTVPAEFRLYANHPNPFNAETTIGFAIAEPSKVMMTIYDILGRQVAEIDFGRLNPGIYSRTFDAGKLSSGIYFCRLEAGDLSAAQKLLLIK